MGQKMSVIADIGSVLLQTLGFSSKRLHSGSTAKGFKLGLEHGLGCSPDGSHA